MIWVTKSNPTKGGAVQVTRWCTWRKSHQIIVRSAQRCLTWYQQIVILFSLQPVITSILWSHMSVVGMTWATNSSLEVLTQRSPLTGRNSPAMMITNNHSLSFYMWNGPKTNIYQGCRARKSFWFQQNCEGSLIWRWKGRQYFWCSWVQLWTGGNRHMYNHLLSVCPC